MTRMVVHKYLASKMYGFLRDSQGREVFFHLGSFRPMPEETEPIPPIPGEEVDVDVDFESGESEKAPRASSVSRLGVPFMLHGVVDMFDATSGYGFIQCEGVLYFLHRSEVRDGKVPLSGNPVTFYAGSREGKSRACYVTTVRHAS